MTDDYDPPLDSYLSWLEAIAEMKRRHEEQQDEGEE